MKISPLVPLVVACATLPCVFNSQGAVQNDDLFVSKGLYLRTQVGAAVQQDGTFVEDTFFPGKQSATITFNPGVRLSLAMGCNFNDSLAAELETGLIWNSVDTIAGFPVSSGGGRIDQYSVPVMANLIYRFHTNSRWSPYVGAGAGAVIDTLDFEAGGGSLSDTSVAFAYQAEAGVNYALSRNATFGFGYKFLGSLSQDFNVGGLEMELRDNYVHSLLLSFNWQL